MIEILEENMKKLGLDARNKTPCTSVEKLETGKFKVNLENGQSLEAD